MENTLDLHSSGQSIFSDDFCAALDTTDLPIYIIDPATFEIIYCNEAIRTRIGWNPLGQLCHKVMQLSESPCPDCPAVRLLNGTPGDATEYLGPDGLWYLVKASPLCWQGRRLCKLTCTDITKLKQLESELRLHNEEYSAVIRQSTNGVMRYNIKTGEATVNIDGNLNHVEEYTIPNEKRIAFVKRVVAKDSQPTARCMFQSIHAGKPSAGYDIQLLPENRPPRWVHLDYTLIKDDSEKPHRAVVFFRDITEQREKEIAYERWSARMKALMTEYASYMEVNLSKDIILAEGRYGSWEAVDMTRRYSKSLVRLADLAIYEEDQIVFRRFFHRERLLGQFLEGKTDGSVEYRARIEGDLKWYKADVQMVNDPETGDILASILVSVLDMNTKEKADLAHRAERDMMTDLYNHAAAESFMKQVLASDTGERCCFLIIDLDDLRDINSTLGHPEGDRALTTIADCMKQEFGRSDIMGRIGGDEFVVLMRDAPDDVTLDAMLSEFLGHLNSHFIGPKLDRPVRASIGGSIGIAGKDDFETLYRKADLALFYTKAMGKNSFHMYDPSFEKREFSYTPSSASLSLANMDMFDSKEIKKLLFAMSAYFSMVVSANLTKNSYYMMEYASYTMQKHREKGVYDQLIDDATSTFHPEDRAGYRKLFLRNHLIKQFEKGESVIRYRGRQLGDDGTYRSTQAIAVVTEDEDTGDICELIFAHVIPA